MKRLKEKDGSLLAVLAVDQAPGTGRHQLEQMLSDRAAKDIAAAIRTGKGSRKVTDAAQALKRWANSQPVRK